MARYQVPPDPRDPNRNAPNRRTREPIPWFWLGMGVVVTVVALAVSAFLANRLLARPPLSNSDVQPTVIVLTAPPSLTPSATPILPTVTVVPTFTPIPTPDTAVAPETVTVGFYARVANTEGIGVTVRGGPSISNVSLTIAAEDTLLLVLDGPTESDGFLWWQVRLEDGSEGWAAGAFLEPAAAP